MVVFTEVNLSLHMSKLTINVPFPAQPQSLSSGLQKQTRADSEVIYSFNKQLHEL